MRKWMVVLSVVVVALFAMQAFAEYDKDAVVSAMRANGAAMKAVNGALGEEDFFAAAEKLMEIAQNMKSLDAYTPKKGTKEVWDRIHGDLINAAFKGIGACGEGDAEKAKGHLGEISALIKEGHGIFK